MASTNVSPNHSPNLSALSTITQASEYVTSTGGFLNVNSTTTIAGSLLPIIGASTAIGVAIVDGSGNQITTFGGTQYTDGVATITHPIGTMPVYNNAGIISQVSLTNGLPIQVIGTPTVAISGTVPVSGNLTATLALPPELSVNNASIGASSITVTAPGVQLVSIAGPLGDALDTTGTSLNVNITNPALSVNALSSQTGIWTVQPGNIANTKPWLTTLNQGGNSALITNAGALRVDGFGTIQVVNNQQVGGDDIRIVTPGIALTALAGPLGDPIDTTGDALNVSIKSTTLSLMPTAGQVSIAVTGKAVQFKSAPLANGVIVSAKVGNVASIEVGANGVTNTADGTGNGYILSAGASVSFAVTNASSIWVNGTSGDIVSYAGS